MVLINNLTIDEINAALLHLQRARTEVVGGTKGSTVQNITISNKGGGSTVDYAPTITALSNRIDKNTDDIESVEGEIDKIQATLEQLSDNGISSMTFDPITRQLQINTQDGEVYSCDITSENITLNFDATTNKLTLEMGEQYQEVTLPYINANEKGSANGVATLDSSGRIPYSQLPESAMEFLGQWNASTNTPYLADGTGTNGDFYVCNVGGTVTFGTGNTQTFVPNDRVIYNGATSQWIKLPAGQVSSVNGMSGDVTLTASDINYSTGVTIKDKIDANAPVQSDWNVTDTTSMAYIKNKPSVAVLGNTVGCGLGTASAGSCATAARSDHVHPLPAVLGGIALNAGNYASFNEGLRINVANNGYAILNIGAAAGTTSGAGGFWIGTNCATAAGKLYINYGTSNKASYFCCCSDGTVFWCGNVCGTTSNATGVYRGQTGNSNNDYSVLLGWSNTAANETGIYASNQCTLTFNPSTGDLKKCGGSLNGYTAWVEQPSNTMHYVLVDLGTRYGGNAVAQIYSYKYFINKSDSYSEVITQGGTYGDFAYAHLGTESSPSSCIWLRFTGWKPMLLCGSYPITIVCNTTTAPSGITFVSPRYIIGQRLYPHGSCVSCTSTANNDVGLFYGCYSNSSMPGTYGNIIQMQSGTGALSRWGYQVAFPTNGCLQYRRWTNTTSIGGWNSFITSENISTQHVACADHATCACSGYNSCTATYQAFGCNAFSNASLGNTYWGSISSASGKIYNVVLSETRNYIGTTDTDSTIKYCPFNRTLITGCLRAILEGKNTACSSLFCTNHIGPSLHYICFCYSITQSELFRCLRTVTCCYDLFSGTADSECYYHGAIGSRARTNGTTGSKEIGSIVVLQCCVQFRDNANSVVMTARCNCSSQIGANTKLIVMFR